MDCNGSGEYNCLVQKRTISYNKYSKFDISRCYSITNGRTNTVDPITTYTVTFDPNGGSVPQSTKTVVHGGTLDALPLPTRSGYTFICWSTAKVGAGAALTEDSYKWLTFDEDTTLYAQWKINCFNHTYDADTCTNCGARLPYDNGFDASAAGTYQVSEKTAYIRTGPYQVKDLVRTMSRGETLRVIGSVINSYNNIWMKTADGYYVHADKLTLYSETQAQSYYVILDDGSVCSRITVTNGGTYGNLPTPAKEGYTFDSWFTSASGGVRVTASTTVSLTNNQTLYAQWSRIPTDDGYTITFNADGGECSIDTMKTNAEGKLSSLPIPTRDNCTFGGWRMIVGGSELWRDVDTNTVFTKNTKVYASWIYGSCTVSFNANGGTVSQGSKIVTAGRVYGDLPTPTRNGYTFDGWYTKASGGILMTSNTGVAATDDHTLYAHWSANPTQTTWGTWSAWSTTPYSASSTRQVETQQVKVSDAYTEYRYGLWRNASNASWCPDYGASLSSSGGSWYESYSSWSTTRMYQDTGHNALCSGSNHNHTHVSGYDSSGRANWHIYSDDGTFTGWGRLYYYWEETRTIPATYETQYRYRDLITP